MVSARAYGGFNNNIIFMRSREWSSEIILTITTTTLITVIKRLITILRDILLFKIFPTSERVSGGGQNPRRRTADTRNNRK